MPYPQLLQAQEEDTSHIAGCPLPIVGNERAIALAIARDIKANHRMGSRIKGLPLPYGLVPPSLLTNHL